MIEALSSIHKCVFSCGRRESKLLTEGSEPAAILAKHTQQILLAYVAVLSEFAHQDLDQVKCERMMKRTFILLENITNNNLLNTMLANGFIERCMFKSHCVVDHHC